MSNDKRKSRDFSGLDPKEQKMWAAGLTGDENARTSGVGNSPLKEAVPNYQRGLFGGCETKISGKNNTWIILGRDRPHDSMSGYGGKANTQAGAIDIVVGRMGNLKETPKGGIRVDPNFFADSARIYISQKADIDDYFKLVGDTQHEGMSGIGIKADGVRIIGRRGVKIVSGAGKNKALGKELDSLGRPLESKEGIELIGANDVGANPLEPLVKAYRLADTLKILVDEIMDLRGIVDALSAKQTKINQVIGAHTHQVAGVQATPSGELASFTSIYEAQKMDQVNSKLYKLGIKMGNNFVTNRLEPTGNKWFGSMFNKTN
jgi:hypothetical protein|tara:strand:- start:1831 stop:2787 length:957 start_codon:yes stop_codon:yes gene_type:complete